MKAILQLAFAFVLIGALLVLPCSALAQALSKAGGMQVGTTAQADSPPAPLCLSNLQYGPLSGSPEDMARTYLRSQSQRFQMKPDLSDLAVSIVQESPAGHHVRFYQTYRGIPVYQADVVVSIDRKNFVEFFASNYKPNIAVPTVDAVLSENAAIQNARAYLGVRGELHGRQTSQLMVKVDKGQARLVYRVVVPAFDPRGDWEVLVDASTGEVISVVDMTCFHKPAGSGDAGVLKVDGSGLVFDPDPLTTALATYGSPGYVDNNDADSPELNAQRFPRVLRDITFSGGLYRLTGPFINVIDWDSPPKPVVTATHPDSFRYTRLHDGFEAVNVYFHIDRSQRWIQSLGFNNIQNTPIEADPHGFNGADNSAYYPSTNRMTFGEGGLDDAEDADVILHEYGHAIHHGTVPGWSGSGQQGALGEGFGDYWAESYSRSLGYWQPPHQAYFWVFDWDGHNPFWPGRILNYTARYPGGLTGAIHTDGQMWSSSLMSIWDDIGREVLDKLVLQSHFYLPASGVTMTQNAEAVIQADRNLYGGAHLQSIVYWFGVRGFINPANYVPQITHTPLTDTENLSGPYAVTATIVQGAAPLDPSSLKVHWTRTSTFTDSLLMVSTGTPNEYRAQIPGNGFAATYRYYVIARDSGGAVATHPTGAPASYHSFRAGPDTIPPVITHTPLRDQARIRWPALVRATVTDNLGVDSVWVDYMWLRGSLSGSFGLVPTTGANYQGVFPLDTSQVQIGDTVVYKVVARDRSGAHNIATHPPVGLHRFAIISARGVVLVVDDDPATVRNAQVPDKGIDDRPSSEKGASARLIARTLTEVGFVVDTANFAAHDPAGYPNYDVVIWTAGASTANPMFNDGAKRAALVNRALSGGKIWVEGGEVGYRYRRTLPELDPDFRRHVLHCSTWVSDVSGGTLRFIVPTHPVFTSPHAIAEPIAFTGTGWGIRDAMRLIPGDPGTQKIGGWLPAFPDTAGLLVYNPLPDPTVGQIVFTMFSINNITDTLTAKRLTENIVEFLMTRPGGALISATPTSVSFGAVQLSDSAIQMVRIQNLGTGTLNVSNVTNANVRFSVSPRTFNLGPQDTTLLRVVFRPLEAGDQYDTLRFVSNATVSPMIPLSGRGGIANLVVRPDSIVVIRQAGPDTTFRTLTVKNSGTDTLRFTIEESLASLTQSMVRSMQQQPSVELPKGVSSLANPPITYGRGGPDAFGYMWIDSDEPGGPSFNWVDIRSVGTQITSWTGGADDGYATVPLPFTFSFYGTPYTGTINVCTNGFLSFTSTSVTWTNTAIPTTTEPNNALYVFWDDLNPAAGGTVHYYADAANQRFIVQFTDVPHFGTTEPGLYTFQAILKANGEILYQYLNMQQTLNSATIGIENADGTVALQVVYDAAYMHDSLAILFTRDAVPWLSTDISEGVLIPSDSVNVQVRVRPVNMAPGTNRANLVVSGNVSTGRTIPVRLEVLVDVQTSRALPTEFALDQNYPNPFNPATVIRYALPVESNVTLKIFNILGQEVATLVSGVQTAGYYETSWQASAAASGVYFFRIDAAPTNGGRTFTQVRKMLIIK